MRKWVQSARLKEIIAKYPGTKGADEAKKLLKELGQ